MANFFDHAPARNTHQKIFLEAVTNRQNVIAGLPLGVSAVSIYAFASMLSGGMVVAVCPNVRQIRRNLDYFRSAGFKFPDVAFLDGTQMPHEERTVHQEINHNRVRLLYTTPERFTSLTFLQILVHTDIHFMVVEEADRFLPVTPGHGAYLRLQEEGFAQLRKLPTLALMTPPLPGKRMRELAERLSLPAYQAIQCPPLLSGVQVEVRRLMTEHQKFQTLADRLSGSPGPGRNGRLDDSGSVLIQAAYPAQAEKLGASLRDYGFDPVWITHMKKSPQEQGRVLDVANTRLNAIIVNAGSEMRYWSPPVEAQPQVVFWSPPVSLEDLLMQVFRQSPELLAGYGAAHRMRGLCLYTKEDFQAAVKRLQANRHLDDLELRKKLSALRHYRRWVLSPGCRLQSLAAYYEGSTRIELPPCGVCDECRAKTRKPPFAARLLTQVFRHWAF